RRVVRPVQAKNEKDVRGGKRRARGARIGALFWRRGPGAGQPRVRTALSMFFSREPTSLISFCSPARRNATVVSGLFALQPPHGAVAPVRPRRAGPGRRTRTRWSAPCRRRRRRGGRGGRCGRCGTGGGRWGCRTGGRARRGRRGRGPSACPGVDGNS